LLSFLNSTSKFLQLFDFNLNAKLLDVICCHFNLNVNLLLVVFILGLIYEIECLVLVVIIFMMPSRCLIFFLIQRNTSLKVICLTKLIMTENWVLTHLVKKLLTCLCETTFILPCFVDYPMSRKGRGKAITSVQGFDEKSFYLQNVKAEGGYLLVGISFMKGFSRYPEMICLQSLIRLRREVGSI